MGNNVFKYIWIGALILLMQVLIFNNIRFGGYINPYIYVFFILLLPIYIKGWVLLLIAFGLGLSMDAFSDSGGMHAAATIFMAFCRPSVIRLISVREEFESGTVPSILNMGSTWIITYSIILIFLHHSLLFFLEIFRFTEILQTLQRVVYSGALSFVFVILGFYLIDRSMRKRRS